MITRKEWHIIIAKQLGCRTSPTHKEYVAIYKPIEGQYIGYAGFRDVETYLNNLGILYPGENDYGTGTNR